MNAKNHVVETHRLNHPPFVLGKTVSPKEQERASGDAVFIVHGRDDETKTTVERFVDELGLRSVIFHEQPSDGQSIFEAFEKISTDAGFAVVLLTPDDLGASKNEAVEEHKPRASQHVIFELGYFLGELGSERICVLYKEGVERPSDIHGLVYVPMDTANGWQTKLGREMKNAGLPINLDKARENQSTA